MSALTFETLSAELTQALAQQQATPPKTVARCTLGRDKVMVLVEYPLDSTTAESFAKQTLDWLEQHLRAQFDTTGLPDEAADLAEELEEVAVQLYLKHLSEAKPFTMRSFTWKVDDGFADLFGEPAAIAPKPQDFQDLQEPEKPDNEGIETEHIDTGHVGTEGIDTEHLNVEDTESIGTEDLDTESIDTENLDTEILDTESSDHSAQIEADVPTSEILSLLSEDDEDERVLLALDEDHLPLDLEPDPEGLEAALDDDLGFNTELGPAVDLTADLELDDVFDAIVAQNEIEQNDGEQNDMEPDKSDLDFGLDLDTNAEFIPGLSTNSEAALEADLSLGVPHSEQTPNAPNDFSLPGEAPKIESADLDLPTVHLPIATPSTDGTGTSDFFDLEESLSTETSKAEAIETSETEISETETSELETSETETSELGTSETGTSKTEASGFETFEPETSELEIPETLIRKNVQEQIEEDEQLTNIAEQIVNVEDKQGTVESSETAKSKIALPVDPTNLVVKDTTEDIIESTPREDSSIDELDFHETHQTKSDGIVSDDWVPDDLSDLSLDPAETDLLEADTAKVGSDSAEEANDFWAAETALLSSEAGLEHAALHTADLDDTDLDDTDSNNAVLDNTGLDNTGLDNTGLENIGLDDTGVGNTGLENTDTQLELAQPATALDDDPVLYGDEASEDEDFENRAYENEDFDDADSAYHPKDESHAYYLKEEGVLPEEDENIAAIDEAEVQQQREQWQQQTKRNPWVAVGALGFLLLGVLGFIFTRPCTFGTCDRIETAQQQGNEALSGLGAASTLAEVTEIKDQLDDSVKMLEPIPAWSSHHNDAQAVLPGFKQELTALDLVTQAQGLAYSAALKSLEPPHPTATWETVASEWREAIATLSEVPADSPVRGLADRKLTEYRANLSTIVLRIEIESAAETSLRQAQSAASQATQQAKQANSLQAWETVLADWNEAVASLNQVPQGTQAYSEAQKILPDYEEERLAARDRVEQERSASRILSRAQQLATSAQRAETEERWTAAVENWTQAVIQIGDIPSSSLTYTAAQNQLETYTAALETAETNAAASLRFQPIEPNFYLLCGTSDAQKCTYDIRAGKIRLALAEGYDRVINESITPPDQRRGVESNAQLTSQSNQLLEQIALLSRQAQIPVELYDSKGGFLARYQPSLAGFVRQ